MPPRLYARCISALLLCPVVIGAQGVLGKFTTHNDQGAAITLILQADGPGKVTGSLTGNGVSYLVEGQQQGEEVTGTMKNSAGGVFFEASRDGSDLRLILIEPGADGRPDYSRGRELSFSPDASSGSANVGAAAATAQGPAGARGNPMASGARGSADPFAGTFASQDVTLALRKSGAGYSGTITYQGQSFPATASVSGATLTGRFTSQGSPYDFTVEQAGDGHVALTTGGATYMLQRGTAAGAAANPLAGGQASGNAQAGTGAATGGAALASTAQDRQIAQLLLSSAWCSFSYSGGSTYSGGSYGTTRTQRAVFSPDGTVMQTSGSENTNTGANGNAYGTNQGAGRAFWKVQNGMLMLSTDQANWTPQPLEITRNSNGYPIIKANGTEYMTCQ